MKILDNTVARKAIYATAAAAGAALVALGILDAGVSAQIVAIVGGILGIGVGGLAGTHVTQKPIVDEAAVRAFEKALVEQAKSAIPAYEQAARDAQTALDEVLAEAHRRLGR
ncbi:hypothetical protein F8M49_21245 [Rhodococcus zopfii]|uniref:Holin n=1 Tax=Rhodococcus zopfii TaxID=43772 RepID=A0ABU3WTC4_9NOCA|nr:hypothetical protein [Rhodococcus zopfii]MDV2477246.1 hypothetical protein [Rhodococcus zopfii]